MTLLLGFGAGIAMKHCPGWMKYLTSLPFLLLGDFFGGSYGIWGVAKILLFLLTREVPYRVAVQLGLMILLSLQMAGFPDKIGIQIYAIAAMLPIALYSGEKRNRSKALQWSFTLFYPAHMLLLLLIQIIFS